MNYATWPKPYLSPLDTGVVALGQPRAELFYWGGSGGVIIGAWPKEAVAPLGYDERDAKI